MSLTPGEKFVELRKRNGRMSQAKVAEMFGWSQSLQGMIERGERELEESDYYRIREAGHDDVADYLEGKTDHIPLLRSRPVVGAPHGEPTSSLKPTTSGKHTPHSLREEDPMEAPRNVARKLVHGDEMDGAVHDAVGAFVDALNQLEIRIQLNASIVRRLPAVRSEERK